MAASRVAIVLAMARELAPLLRGVIARRIEGVALYELESAVVAVEGIGRDAARHASQIVVGHARPEILISAGVAGALRPEVKVGDVIMAREVVDAENGTRIATRSGEGVVVTAGSIGGEDEKRALRDRFGGDVVDMEAAAVAGVAREQGIEFAAVKAVSDEFDFVLPPLARFVDASGKFATAKFVAYVAVRPQWWRPVRALNRNTRTASVNLSSAVKHLIHQYTQATREENVSLG